MLENVSAPLVLRQFSSLDLKYTLCCYVTLLLVYVISYGEEVK